MAEQVPSEQCEHMYTFAGVVYSHADWPLPGSGACARYYEDKFFCQRCLQTKYANKRENGNSYIKPIQGSMPK